MAVVGAVFCSLEPKQGIVCSNVGVVVVWARQAGAPLGPVTHLQLFPHYFIRDTLRCCSEVCREGGCQDCLFVCRAGPGAAAGLASHWPGRAACCVVVVG
jgi:hypothetical protein